MNTKILICFLPLVLLACKKHQPEILPEPNSPEQAKPLASARSINSNGHSILVSYNYNSMGKLYQEISKDESTGMEMFQEYRYKDGMLYLSDISDEQRKLSKINYSYEQNKLVKMRYFEYDRYQNSEFLFEYILEYKDEQIYKISTVDVNGLPGSYTLFTSSDGNITQTRTYSQTGVLMTTSRYEYDRKLNPYFGQYDKLQSAIAYSRSNIIKSVQTDQLSNNTVTANYSYDYNRAGQPTSMFLVGDRRKLLTTYYYE